MSVVDVLVEMDRLTPAQLEDWRFGRIPYLERVVQGSLGKLSRIGREIRNVARAQGLRPSLTVYRQWGKGPKPTLRFSKSGAPSVELAYATHWLLQRTAQLETANKELEAFSCSVSHDLRAPLRAIDGFSRILLEDYVDKYDGEGKRLLNIIRSNTQKMGELIDDLLALSRLGRKEIDVSDIDMDKLVKGLFDELGLDTDKQKLQVNLKPLPPACGDMGMIRQVLANLLLNAVKFTKPRETAVIEVGGYNEDSKNIYYVKDNGVGFDMRYKDKLFGVFQRLHNGDEFEGTGIGLVIVQRIINRHDGQIWAEGKVSESSAPKANRVRSSRYSGFACGVLFRLCAASRI